MTGCPFDASPFDRISLPPMTRPSESAAVPMRSLHPDHRAQAFPHRAGRPPRGSSRRDSPVVFGRRPLGDIWHGLCPARPEDERYPGGEKGRSGRVSAPADRTGRFCPPRLDFRKPRTDVYLSRNEEAFSQRIEGPIPCPPFLHSHFIPTSPPPHQQK